MSAEMSSIRQLEIARQENSPHDWDPFAGTNQMTDEPLTLGTGPVIPYIIAEHAAEATSLAERRQLVMTAPHYSLRDIVDFDERIEANIDGLRIAGQEGWKQATEAFERDAYGGAFVLGLLALERRSWRVIEPFALELAGNEEAIAGFSAALQWVDRRHLRGTVQAMLSSDSILLRRLGLVACRDHRVDPGDGFIEILKDHDPVLRAAALKAPGMLKRKDLMRTLVHCEPQSEEEHAALRWSLTLLGDTLSTNLLTDIATQPGPCQMDALHLVLRALPIEQAMEVIRRLVSEPAQHRAAIVGTGILGLPSSIPWLCEQMQKPEVARVAGEAFAMITGADIDYLDLDAEAPEDFEAGPNDDPNDEDVALDEDEDLPWPDAEKTWAWWDEQSDGTDGTARYLLGDPLTGARCEFALLEGQQRQRCGAAIDLAFLRTDDELFNTQSRGEVQVSATSGMRGRETN